MKATVLAACLLLGTGAAATVLAQETVRPEVGEYVQAYQGSAGAVVWTTRIGPRANNQALVQITGVDHEWDRKIHRMRLEEVRNEKRHSLPAGGQSTVVLNIDAQGRGYLHLPGEANPIAVGYNRDLSQQGNAEHFLTDYLQQGQ